MNRRLHPLYDLTDSNLICYQVTQYFFNTVNISTKPLEGIFSAMKSSGCGDAGLFCMGLSCGRSYAPPNILPKLKVCFIGSHPWWRVRPSASLPD